MTPVSIPERSPRNKRTDVKDVETCNLQKVWDDINLYSIYNSNYQRRFFINTMECDHRTWETGGEVTSKKENFELFHIFGQTSSFLKKVWVS